MWGWYTGMCIPVGSPHWLEFCSGCSLMFATQVAALTKALLEAAFDGEDKALLDAIAAVTGGEVEEVKPQ